MGGTNAPHIKRTKQKEAKTARAKRFAMPPTPECLATPLTLACSMDRRADPKVNPKLCEGLLCGGLRFSDFENNDEQQPNARSKRSSQVQTNPTVSSCVQVRIEPVDHPGHQRRVRLHRKGSVQGQVFGIPWSGMFYGSRLMAGGPAWALAQLWGRARAGAPSHEPAMCHEPLSIDNRLIN